MIFQLINKPSSELYLYQWSSQTMAKMILYSSPFCGRELQEVTTLVINNKEILLFLMMNNFSAWILAVMFKSASTKVHKNEWWIVREWIQKLLTLLLKFKNHVVKCKGKGRLEFWFKLMFFLRLDKYYPADHWKRPDSYILSFQCVYLLKLSFVTP